jgi:hypothetical protein
MSDSRDPALNEDSLHVNVGAVPAPGRGGQVSRTGAPSVTVKAQAGAPDDVTTAPCFALQGRPSHCASPVGEHNELLLAQDEADTLRKSIL